MPLIASDEILEKLDLMELAYERQKKANKMMIDLPRLVIAGDQQKMIQNQKDIEISSLLIKNIKDDIIKLMRKKLNEI